jgi:hypothetical protein
MYIREDWDSSASIATRLLTGRPWSHGSIPGRSKNFFSPIKFRPILEPTKPIIKWLLQDKVALGQVFSEYFGSPANLHSTNTPKIILIYHRG